ncbi:PAS domain S-box protein [Catenuloplanes atrovinosus]|uniref:PAS domain S-box-containing protein n=1 Tax=Catenuloplanes atrovinosus TaxID=137266 RepID=A0AAE3YY49_9ACTN|nr:PAS domain S-box protein [Catenuloplanes atrovinosus]MDR7280847.1 PAS domain S-box-containing protein [Catenuloplanes atrovinosus]
MTPRRWMAVHAVVMLVLGGAVFTSLPDSVVFALIGLTTVGAIAGGVRLNGPLRRAPWWWLGATAGVMAIGDTFYGQHQQGTALIVSEVAYLAMFPLIVIGLVQLTRPNGLAGDRSRLLDWITFGASAALLTWVLLIGPALRHGGGDGTSAATHSVGCLFLLLATVGLTINTRLSVSVTLLAVGSAGLLFGDIAWLVLSVRYDGWPESSPFELAYLLFYAAWGQAALHPSMSRLSSPPATEPGELRLVWKVLLGVSVLIPPGVLLAETLRGPVTDGVVIAALATVIYGAVFARLYDAAEKHRRLLARERDLREICGTLVAATGPDEVDRAIRDAVRALLEGAEHRIVLRVHRADGKPTAASSVWGPGIPAPYPLPTPAAARRTRLLRTQALHPALADQLGGLPGTLVCPLVLDDSAGPPRVGALFVAADRPVLAALQDSIEVVAVQATLALERIFLTDEVNRRESDQYVSAVVQNTSDVVVIVDEADRIRYYSPSLPAVLGVRPRAFGTLADLVQPDDRPQVHRTLELARGSGGADGVHEEWSLMREDGSRVVLDVSCRDLRTDRLVRGYVLTLCDAAGRHRREQAAIQRALLDSAPGKNRRSVTNRFR